MSAACAPSWSRALAAPSIRRFPASDGMLSADARREFVLGLYQLPRRDGAMRDARSAGFNLLNLPPEPKAYDEAHALGIRGWSSVGSLPEGAGRAEAEQKMRATVGRLRRHPGLWFWETEDEPTFVWTEPSKIRVPAERIVDTARFLRGIDPDHPLYLNHSPTHLVPTLRGYNAASDIVATDIYPVIPPGMREQYALWPDGRHGDLSDTGPGQVGRYADKMRAVAGPGRAVFMVLQGFAWEDLRGKDRDPAKVLYPTREQLRFMAWQSVIHGANGILWWGLAYLPPGASLWDDLKAVVGELSAVGAALAAPATRRRLRVMYRDTGHSLDRGVEWILKPDGRGAVLAAVNADPNPVDATFAGLEAYRLRESASGNPPAGWDHGRLRERFEPFGTRVWRLSPA